MSRFLKIATSRRASLGIAIGLALLMATGSAWAADPQAAPQQATTPSHDREAPTGSHIVKAKDMEKVVVFAGAVHAPGDAQWVDDDASVATLPMVRDADSGAR